MFNVSRIVWRCPPSKGRELSRWDQNPRSAEALLWTLLRRRRPRFRHQHVMAGFIVDFVSLGGRLVIELDGRIHYGTVPRARS